MANKTDLCHIDEPGDPDVAGLGVTVSFLATVILTAVAILILYFRSELESHSARYNSIDRAFVCFVTRKSHDRKRQGVRHNAINAALWKLLETLSDQQLITGTALAVPVYVRLADSANYSVYSFGMATTTIFLSCLTHMCTLVALGDKFRASGRGWSLVAMLVLLFLLAPILLVSNFPTFIVDPAFSVKCAFSQFSMYGSTATTIFGLQAALILNLVIGGYIRRMIDVFRRSRRPQNQYKTAPSSMFTKVIRTIPEMLWRAEVGRKIERRWVVNSIANEELNSLHTMKAIWLLIGELRASYLWEIIWLAFYYNFGIVSVIFTWTTLPPLSQWSLSFGQLVPIMLLVFGLVPLYSEYREKRNEPGDQLPQKETSEILSTQLGNTTDVLNGESICPLPPDENIAPKNEISNTISERPNVVISQQQQQQPQETSEPELGLYQAIVSRSPVFARAVIIFVGLFFFLILQFLATILSGVFGLAIIRNPEAWLFISVLPWMVLAYSFAATMMQCVRDVSRGRRRDRERWLARTREQ
ncbi:hypothetical protein N431DRAFT_460155 [Stipitochalara longipes BDJ]|nr:hypothetical protein N431DRAFT_460155 [Stipitochalara longipes BDJ]